MSLTQELAEDQADDGQMLLDLTVGSAPINPDARVNSRAIHREFAHVANAARIDAALAEMRDFLSMTHPATDAEALHSLRVAFPTVPLTDRIAAIRTRFFA
jgi:hypothetical protein